MSRRRNVRKSLHRPKPSRSERQTIMVFTEGEVSETDYVKGLKKLSHIRHSFDIKIHEQHGVPLTLVEYAIQAKKNDPELDHCWCVFDVEYPKNHPNLKHTVALAKENEVNLAISNPCFELWLVLHFVDHTKHDDTATIERVSRQCDNRIGKHINPREYLPKRKIAVRRALSLAKRHKGNGTNFPDDNPSSSMSDFILALEPDL